MAAVRFVPQFFSSFIQPNLSNLSHSPMLILRISILSCGLLFIHSMWLSVNSLAAPPALADTKPLDWQEADLSTRMMDGLHRYIERKIESAPDVRQRHWQ